MRSALAWLGRELLEMLPPTLFFFLVFELVVVLRSLMGSGANLDLTTTAAAVVGALVVGKSILIADALPLFRWFADRRLILNIVWRVILYQLVVLMFQIVEELVPLAREHGSLAAGVDAMWAEVRWPIFLATHLAMLFFLSLYSFMTAVIGIIGRDRVIARLFSRGAATE